jgi:hypothetical protein
VQAQGSTEQRARVINVQVARGTGPLVITGTSSNTSIILNSYIQVNPGDGYNQVVTIFTARNQLGTCRITLTVRDAKGVTATTAFDFTVFPNPRLAAPIGAQSGAAGTASKEIPVSLTGGTPPYTATGLSSDISVIPNANIVFTRKMDGTYVLQVTPVAGTSGNVTITLEIKDSANASFSTTFVFAVQASDSSDPGFFTMDNITFFIVIPAGGLIVLVAAVCISVRCLKCECSCCKKSQKRLSGFGGSGLRGSVTKSGGTELAGALQLDAPSPHGDSPISMPAAAL